MPKFHVVTLDEAQRLLLEKSVLGGTASARTVTRARIPSTGEVTEQVAAWEVARNCEATGVNWRFTSADARIKLRHLYPSH